MRTLLKVSTDGRLSIGLRGQRPPGLLAGVVEVGSTVALAPDHGLSSPALPPWVPWGQEGGRRSWGVVVTGRDYESALGDLLAAAGLLEVS